MTKQVCCSFLINSIDTEMLSTVHVGNILSLLLDEIFKQQTNLNPRAEGILLYQKWQKIQSAFISWPLAQPQYGEQSTLSPIQYQINLYSAWLTWTTSTQH